MPDEPVDARGNDLIREYKQVWLDLISMNSPHRHSWTPHYDYENPPRPTGKKICSTCHEMGDHWVPNLADTEALEAWLDDVV